MRQVWSHDPRREVREAIREANRALSREDVQGSVPGAIITLATVVVLVLVYAFR